MCDLCSHSWTNQDDIGGMFDWSKPCCRARDLIYQTIGREGGKELRQGALKILSTFYEESYVETVKHWITEWWPEATARRKRRREVVQ